MNWIDKYVSFTSDCKICGAKGCESPDIFHKWAASSALATIMGRKCFIRHGYSPLYSNMYILFIAVSAECRKSSAIKMPEEYILNPMRKFFIIKSSPTGKSILEALANPNKPRNELTILCEELSTFINKMTTQGGLLEDLNNLYDSPKENDYITRHSGKFKLTNVFLNIIGGSTVSWLRDHVPTEIATEGGFTSRVMFICAEEPRGKVYKPYLCGHKLQLVSELINHAEELYKFFGEIRITESYDKKCKYWYEKTPLPKYDLRMRPYFGRRLSHLFKLSMVLAGATCADLPVMDGDIFDEALSMLKEAESKMHIAYRDAIPGKSVQHIDRVKNQIINSGGFITHSKLLKMNNYHVNADEFKKLIDTLEQSGTISVEVRGRGKVYKILKEE